jgi:transcriptional regulator with XRE-family HTH domain
MSDFADTILREVADRILVNGESGVALLREWRGMTVKEVALAAGLTPQQVTAVENDPGDPEDALIEKLARGLRVTTDVVVAMYEQDDSNEAGAVWPANDR